MRKHTLAVTAAFSILALSACGSGDTTDSTGAAGAGAGDGADMRLALNQTEEHPSFIALDNFGTRLSEETDGRYSIEVYPNEELGAQAEALQYVGDGSVDMGIVSGTQLENLNDDFAAFNMPGAFDSVEHQMNVIHDEEIVGELYASLEESNNVTILGGFTQGTRSIYSDAPVETPGDLAGLKIRVQESPLHIGMIEAMGGSATPMAFGEVYTALQSGVLDGAENNEVSYFTQKHFEVAPFYSRTNHLVGLDYLIINTDVLNGMSEEDRQAFLDGWTATHEEHTELWAAATEQAITDAEAGGATFVEVDAAAFSEALSTLQDEFLTTDSQKALFEASRSAAN
ncbi:MULTISPECIES: TRAP transporter substrate-binding protein [unclassified Ornithinimicrobium]|uniref:TRAP transporter substrate-binding protein n=1 Tax=unclassified Ornithinimicrobium TaxID=2615080 RepID=UPI003854FCB9